MLTESDFNSRFKIIKNKADGNCLFESIENALIYSEYEFKNGITNSKKIRKMIGEFYRDFDRDKDYPDDTIEYRIKMGILFDNMDDELQHDDNISNDQVWASMTDVLICSLIFQMNINLYTKHCSFTLEDDNVFTTDIFEITKIESQYNFTQTANLLYSNNNHFEALERKF